MDQPKAQRRMRDHSSDLKCLPFGIPKNVFVWTVKARTLPQKEVILKNDLLLVFLKRKFCLDITKASANMATKSIVKKQSYWSCLAFGIYDA